jgi:hypothetical protein
VEFKDDPANKWFGSIFIQNMFNSNNSNNSLLDMYFKTEMSTTCIKGLNISPPIKMRCEVV